MAECCGSIKDAAEAILQYATNRGKTGQMQWDALESQAAKYDPTFARMADARQKNQYDQGKEDQTTAANTKFAPTMRPLTPAGNNTPTAPAFTPPPSAPSAPGGATTASVPAQASAPTPAPTTPALPGLTPPAISASPLLQVQRGERTTPADTSAPAPTQTAGATPPAGASVPGQTGGPGIQPGPTREAAAALNAPSQTAQGAPNPADVPAPQSQEVAALQADENRYQNIERDTTGAYFTKSGNPIINGQELAPPDQSQVKTSADAVAYKQADADYRAQWNRNNALLKADVDGQRRDLGARIVAQRQSLTASQTDTRAAERERFSQSQQNAREEFSQREQDQRAKDFADRAQKAEADKLKLAQQQPMDPTKQRALFTKGAVDPETGMEGNAPSDYLAATPFYAYDAKGNKIDGGAAKQAMTMDWNDPKAPGGQGGGAQRVNLLNNVLYNTQGFNAHVRPEEVSDWIMGAAKGIPKGADGKPDFNNAYTFSRAKDPIDDGWGPRYSVTFTRPASAGGGSRTLMVPVNEYDTLGNLRGFMSAKNATQPAPSVSGPAIAPAPTRAPSTTAGQTVVSNPRAGVSGHQGAGGNPVVDYFHQLNTPYHMPRGRGPLPPTQPPTQ